ncbi:MAG: 23S rRNA (adenine(2030)-N(6))-methyltransferase RlmJ [Proteobacteria bacterium]|nr:23S rRNA (adenine(2030)-N(6))-methyltransferase RlmJ [Pseudomonadota bacterium]
MLSYRHSFHAGSFADVLKHIVLIEILQHLLKKDKAIHYIDTHAGAGLFDLDSEHSTKLKEFETGINRVKEVDWPELMTYFEIIRSFNGPRKPDYYPGSPMIALRLLRDHDRAWFYELHSTDSRLLSENVAHDRRVKVMSSDGFDGLLSLLPPVSKRALIVIDPAYEIKSDYAEVVHTLRDAHRKFTTGTYALWYPVIERERIERLVRALEATKIPNIQRFELCVRPDSLNDGMTGAGMIVINPPWTLMATMHVLLPRLVAVLGQEPGADYKADTIAAE